MPLGRAGGVAASILPRPVLGVYASLLLILIASTPVGQAVFAICGRRRLSPLAPAVGLGLLCALAWGTVRLPGDGSAALVAVAAAALAALAVLAGRLERVAEDLRTGLPVALAAAVAASLPFLVAGRFGILGTGLNPDMSQHLFAAFKLAAGGTERLQESGYPLGPHALAVAAAKGTGASLVHAFDGLTLAIAVAACVAPLRILAPLRPARRLLGGLLAGLCYMAASYLIQGAFKETLEATLFLAFAVALHHLDRGELAGGAGARHALTALPLAALATGAAYSYSFPGLVWLAGALLLWAASRWREASREALAPAAAAAALFAAAVAPEAGRMADFASFETFNPSGPGLGNLFNRISPLEALGIWPSGDFRLDPGAGAVPAAGFYLGGALALAALAYGLWWWLRRRETALPAAVAAGGALVLYALVSGTPYQEAKAIVVAAPVAMLAAARPLLEQPRRLAPRPLLAACFLGAGAGCSLLALVNGPVGPVSWTPALGSLRHQIHRQSTLVLAPRELLADEHGRDFIVWELRGSRVCVAVNGPPPRLPPGIRYVITQGSGRPPYPGLRLVRTASPYRLWASRRPPQPQAPPCPLIAPGERRANPGGD